MIEIAKSFCFNKKALCLKHLDVSKCQLTDEHITQDFCEMLSSPFTTLKFLSLRDNLIRYKASEAIKDALTLNKSITKLLIDYNPIKRDIME